jgi:hypothetical protein
MDLTSEQAHWIVGGQVAAASLILMLYEARVWQLGALRYALACTLLLLGAQGTLFPVITGAVTPETFDAATAQHLMLAGACLGVGVVELLRARGRLLPDAWRAALPAGLFAAGGIFVFHAQHEMHAPATLLTVQHRILGASLAVSAATKAVSELPHRPARELRLAWLVPLFLAGIQLLLYRDQ